MSPWLVGLELVLLFQSEANESSRDPDNPSEAPLIVLYMLWPLDLLHDLHCPACLSARNPPSWCQNPSKPDRWRPRIDTSWLCLCVCSHLGAEIRSCLDLAICSDLPDGSNDNDLLPFMSVNMTKQAQAYSNNSGATIKTNRHKDQGPMLCAHVRLKHVPALNCSSWKSWNRHFFHGACVARDWDNCKRDLPAHMYGSAHTCTPLWKHAWPPSLHPSSHLCMSPGQAGEMAFRSHWDTSAGEEYSSPWGPAWQE